VKALDRSNSHTLTVDPEERHHIRLVSAPFTSFRLVKFGLVPFADRVRCLHVYNNEPERRIYGGWAKTAVPF